MEQAGDDARSFLTGLFHTAVGAAHPAACLPPQLPAPPERGLSAATAHPQSALLSSRLSGRRDILVSGNLPASTPLTSSR